jgi:nicotinate-nucleotide--dimethylbenzimidazole phosphoribosyltransferase
VSVDPAISGAPGIRVVIVQLASEGGAFSFSGEGRARTAVPKLPPLAQCLNDLEDDTDFAEIEMLRLRAFSEACSDSLAPDCRWIRGEDPPRRVTRPLDKHRLDIALSAGRHAAERAKLAGVTHLIGVAPSVCPAPERWLRTTDASAPDAAHALPCLDGWLPEPPVCFDPYDALRCLGSPEIAALVGVAVAAAQMGIPFCLPDPAGGIAVDAAVGLNPGVRAWLDPIPVIRPFSEPSPVRPRSLCAA